MNWEHFRKNVGCRLQLEPMAIHLDPDGHELPLRNEDWVVESIDHGTARIAHPTIQGLSYTLAKDHIRNFVTDPHRSASEGTEYGALVLLIQLYVRGDKISFRPCPTPGQRVPPPPARPRLVETVATRFLKLFDVHGVHRNQISRVFGHGLLPKHLQSDEALLSILTDDMLDSAARFFAIRREWLDGASAEVYPLHDFYKKPEAFRNFLAKLRYETKGELGGVVLAAESESHEQTALIIIEQEIGAVGERTLYRYHLCANWLFQYWKARAFLAACVAIAWKKKVYLTGRKVGIGVIQRYVSGGTFLEYEHDTALPREGLLWHPEDMAVKPKAFMDGLNEGKIGKREGLRVWLQLYDSGLMDAGLPYADVRQAFEHELKNLEPKTRRRQRGVA